MAQAGSNDADWWGAISHILRCPCSMNCGDSTCDVRDATEKCLPLDKKHFSEQATEALDLVRSLTSHKKTQRWVRGRWAREAEKQRCDLETSVPHKRRDGLNKGEIKAVEDLTQLLSFAHYLNINNVGRRKNSRSRGLQSLHNSLHKKLLNLACKLLVTLPSSPHCHVTADDIPKDLRRRNKKLRRVLLYVIYEKIEGFLRNLRPSYRRAGFKLCK